MKMEQRKIHGLEWELQVKQTCPLLGQPNLHTLKAGRKQMYKRRKPRWIEASPLGLAHPHALRVYLPLLVNKTLSSNWAVTLVRHFKFLLLRDRTEQITHFPNSVFSEITETLESLKASAYLLKPLIIWYHSIFPASLPNCSLYELGLQWIQTI